MNNIETTKKSAVENNSLMLKTKAQLVEIILRKDSIEKNLRADINGTNSTLNEIRNKYNSLEKHYDSLNYDYRDMCDEKTFIECELNTTIKKQKRFICFLIIMLCISIVFNYIFI